MSIEGLVINAVQMPVGFAEEARVVWWVASMQELLAWHRKAVLTGWSLKRKDGGWLLVVHVTRGTTTATRREEVAFVRADRSWACFVQLAYGLRNNTLSWKEDRYPIT